MPGPGAEKGLHGMSRRVVLLRVGIDAGCGGIQGPLFEDGSFEFVCIPDNNGVSAHTYGTMLGRDGKPLAGYFAEGRRKVMAGKHVHHDPEFETFTYGDPTTPKRSLRHLRPGDFLAFYCGLQGWDAGGGWKRDRRPALYLAGYFEVALAGMAGEFDGEALQTEFGKNFHVRYHAVFEQQKDDLVLVKGGPGSRLFRGHTRSAARGRTGRASRSRCFHPPCGRCSAVSGATSRFREVRPAGWKPGSWIGPSVI